MNSLLLADRTEENAKGFITHCPFLNILGYLRFPLTSTVLSFEKRMLSPPWSRHNLRNVLLQGSIRTPVISFTSFLYTRYLFPRSHNDSFIVCLLCTWRYSRQWCYSIEQPKTPLVTGGR